MNNGNNLIEYKLTKNEEEKRLFTTREHRDHREEIFRVRDLEQTRINTNKKEKKLH